MKQVIVNSSIEDFDRISKEYNEVRSRRRDQETTREKQYEEYRLKSEEATDIVKDNILSIIREATDNEFMNSVHVTVIAKKYDDNIRCRIKVEYGSPSHTDNSSVPFSWDWEFEFDSTEEHNKKHRTTNSWSGLNATTQEDVDVLKKSVSALEALASVTDDYIVDLISENALNYYDYVTQEIDDYADSDLYLIKKLEALTGTGRYIPIDYGKKYTDFLRIDEVTSKQFKVTIVRVKSPTQMYDPQTGQVKDSLSTKYILEEKRYRKDKVAEMIDNPNFAVYTEDDLDSLMKQFDEQYLASKEED